MLSLWVKVSREQIDKLVHGQLPEIAQVITKIITDQREEKNSEGLTIQGVCFDEGMTLGHQIAHVRIPSPVTPLAVALTVFAAEGYIMAAEKILQQTQSEDENEK
jgi:hypothetical protein